jgi:uncharacterized protein involved in exopolysaccharide biosynthesis
MSVEFRQRTAGEIAAMVKRQKWLIILPMLTVTAAIGYVVHKLPSVYESTSLLTVKPPTISSNLVQSLSNEGLSQRLQTINQEVLSRSSLEPMVQKYDLYKTERNNGMPMELIVQKMYSKDIKVEIEESGEQKVAAFRIRYRNQDPQAARNVTAELASKYVNAQIQTQTEIAESTKDLFDKQLNEKKAALDGLEKQRLDIMTANVATLPESEQGLVAQLGGLRDREGNITKEKEALMNERGRLSDAIGANNRQMRLIEDYGEKETQDTARQAADPENSPGYIEMIKKRADLNASLDNLLKVYKAKHPLVVAKQSEIARVNEEIENLKKSSDRKVASATRSSSRKAELQKQSLELENQRIQAQIGQLEQQMAGKDNELKQNMGQIAALETRINQIPNVKVALEGITAQYQSAKQTYDEILKKKNEAETVVGVETNAQGETIRVQDPANIPQSPVAPKRFILTLVGTGFGLFLGLFFAAIIEIPRLFRIQNIADVKHYTGLQVLASVPPLLSPAERTWIKRAYWLKLVGGVISAIAIVPVVVIILETTKVFERIVS